MLIPRYSPIVFLFALVLTAACASPAAAPEATPTIAAEPEPTPEPTEEPTPEPTPTPVANCMDPDVHADLTNREFDWGAVSQAQRDELADELEAYDFSDQHEEAQSYVEGMIEELRSGRAPDAVYMQTVYAGQIAITPCE